MSNDILYKNILSCFSGQRAAAEEEEGNCCNGAGTSRGVQQQLDDEGIAGIHHWQLQDGSSM